jgi:hypothetical protein
VEREITEPPSILQTEYTSTGIRLYVQERKEKVSVDKTQANRWYKERQQKKRRRTKEMKGSRTLPTQQPNNEEKEKKRQKKKEQLAS